MPLRIQTRRILFFFELNGDGNPSDPSNASLHAWLQENDDEEEDAEDEDYEPSD